MRCNNELRRRLKNRATIHVRRALIPREVLIEIFLMMGEFIRHNNCRETTILSGFGHRHSAACMDSEVTTFTGLAERVAERSRKIFGDPLPSSKPYRYCGTIGRCYKIQGFVNIRRIAWERVHHTFSA